MNQISISLIFLIMISMVLPTSAIMYASGSTDNSEGTTDTGSSEDNSDSPPTDLLPPNVDSSTSDGSTDSTDGSSATSTEDNSTLPSESPLGNNTENVQVGDLVNIVLAMHNQERAAVGVPPLTWSDSLAAHAQPWADKVYETGDSSHSSGVADFGNYGENMAWGGGPSFATPTWLVQTWADEKSNYVPGTPASDSTGHYTQMVDKQSTEVGCGFTSGPAGQYAEYGGTNVLVCQYTPPGNWNNQPPF